MNMFPGEKLQAVVQSVWDSPHSHFYRMFWEKQNVTSPNASDETAWKDIPLISRKDFESVLDPSKRLYVDMKDVEILRTTSGTTSSIPFYFWRNYFPTYLYRWYYQEGARRGISFYPYQNFMTMVFSAREKGVSLVCGDTHNLVDSARLAKDADVDLLIATPTLAYVFSDYLEKEGYISNIRFLVLCGEYCSSSMYRVLKERYPEARFLFEYALSEANGDVGCSSDRCDNPSTEFHIQTDHNFVEVVHGEVVITTLDLPHAMPLIRYRTGDKGNFVSGECPCGNVAPRLAVSGRVEEEKIRIGGGELRVEQVEQALELFVPDIEPLVSVEVMEQAEGSNNRVRLKFFLVARGDEQDVSEVLLERVRVHLLRNIRLTPTLSLQDAVSARLLEVPEIVCVSKRSLGRKHSRIIRR